MSIIKDLEEKLNERKAEGLLRQLPGHRGNLFDFASNDYLGLANHPFQEKGISFKGATGSRLLTGDSSFYHELETFLASHFEAHSALVFNSGYQANLSLISAIPQRGDTIIYDELAHACIKDGARLSNAKFFSFQHNNINDLENKLKKASGKRFIVVEGVYSMDGDITKLEDILNLAQGYEAGVIIDEAHSGGIIGESGKGLSHQFKDHEALLGRIYTFGKAWGAHGACFVGDTIIKDFLVNFARPFIYTTALPLHSLLHIRESIDYQSGHPEFLQKLKNNIEFFKNEVSKTGIDIIESFTPIQPLIFPGNRTARVIASQIAYYGFDVRPILSPTVKKGTERIRICLHSFNEKSHIKQLVTLLSEMPYR